MNYDRFYSSFLSLQIYIRFSKSTFHLLTTTATETNTDIDMKKQLALSQAELIEMPHCLSWGTIPRDLLSVQARGIPF